MNVFIVILAIFGGLVFLGLAVKLAFFGLRVIFGLAFVGLIVFAIILIVGNTEDFALDTRFVSIPNGWIFQVESSLAVECFCRLDHFSEDRLRKVVPYCLCREFLGRV